MNVVSTNEILKRQLQDWLFDPVGTRIIAQSFFLSIVKFVANGIDKQSNQCKMKLATKKMGVVSSRWAARSSKPLRGGSPILGGFDSHLLPLRIRSDLAF